MYKLFLKKIKKKLTLVNIFILTMPLLTPLVSAEKFDVRQEIKISSSRQAADLKNKIFSYIDNVIISQGTLRINAELVQVIQQNDNDINNDNDQSIKGKIYIAKGSPATFEQTLEDGSPISLQAKEIRYEPAKNIVIISGDAMLRQEGSEISGSKITYNFETEYVNAESIKDTKVETVLQPTLKSTLSTEVKEKQE